MWNTIMVLKNQFYSTKDAWKGTMPQGFSFHLQVYNLILKDF